MPPHRLLIRFRRIFRNDQLVLAVLAILVGLAAGVGAILFRLLLGAACNFWPTVFPRSAWRGWRRSSPGGICYWRRWRAACWCMC